MRQSREEAVKNGRKGGINSGKARREKADLKKAALTALVSPVKDKSGEEYTGIEIFIRGLIANLADFKGKNWGKAVDTVIKLTGADVSPEQIKKSKAELKLIQAKIKQLETGGTNIDVEDLTALAKLLNIGIKNNDENTDNPVETVLEETQ